MHSAIRPFEPVAFDNGASDSTNATSQPVQVFHNNRSGHNSQQRSDAVAITQNIHQPRAAVPPQSHFDLSDGEFDGGNGNGNPYDDDDPDADGEPDGNETIVGTNFLSASLGPNHQRNVHPYNGTSRGNDPPAC
jgi:hypothetical protein